MCSLMTAFFFVTDIMFQLVRQTQSRVPTLPTQHGALTPAVALFIDDIHRTPTLQILFVESNF